jgi:hypothetical protein
MLNDCREAAKFSHHAIHLSAGFLDQLAARLDPIVI